METSNELSALWGVSQLVQVRTTGEGRYKKFSLIDIAVLVSGKDASHASKDVIDVCEKFSEVGQNVANFKFSGRGQRDTPVADLRTTLLVVLRLRSRVAQKLTAQVVDVFVRYIGGDLGLAQETLSNHEFQHHLAQQQPDHPFRVFGEDVENNFVNPSRPPPQILNVPGMDSGDHAYLFVSGMPGIIKIGRATDVGTRREQVQRDIKKIDDRAGPTSIAILWKYCGPVEKHMHRLMAQYKVDNLGRLTEYYKCDVETVVKMFPDALACYQEESTVNFGSCEDERLAKRRRLEAELEEDTLRHEAKLKKEAMESEVRRTEELKEQQHKQNLELSQLEFQMKKKKYFSNDRHTTTSTSQQPWR